MNANYEWNEHMIRSNAKLEHLNMLYFGCINMLNSNFENYDIESKKKYLKNFGCYTGQTGKLTLAILRDLA